MFILGRKVKMSQIWKGKKAVPVTVISTEPNMVSLCRTKERDGYEAVQVKFDGIKREFRAEGAASRYKVGDAVDVSTFKEGDKVMVSGISKGRG